MIKFWTIFNKSIVSKFPVYLNLINQSLICFQFFFYRNLIVMFLWIVHHPYLSHTALSEFWTKYIVKFWTGSHRVSQNLSFITHDLRTLLQSNIGEKHMKMINFNPNVGLGWMVVDWIIEYDAYSAMMSLDLTLVFYKYSDDSTLGKNLDILSKDCCYYAHGEVPY